MTGPTDVPAVFDGTHYLNKFGQVEGQSVSPPTTTTDQTARDAAAAALAAVANALPKWQPSTVYSTGDAVVNPFGQVVLAKTGFTSGAVYSASDWNDPLAGGYALAPLVWDGTQWPARGTAPGPREWRGPESQCPPPGIHVGDYVVLELGI